MFKNINNFILNFKLIFCFNIKFVQDFMLAVSISIDFIFLFFNSRSFPYFFNNGYLLNLLHIKQEERDDFMTYCHIIILLYNKFLNFPNHFALFFFSSICYFSKIIQI